MPIKDIKAQICVTPSKCVMCGEFRGYEQKHQRQLDVALRHGAQLRVQN